MRIGLIRDTQFHQLYPLSIQELAGMHWTPLNIARRVVQFLAPDECVKILDIGTGVGKFCLAAAYYKPLCPNLWYRAEEKSSGLCQ